MNTVYRPGQHVPVSGIYNVVDHYSRHLGRRVTCVKGEPFPPLQNSTEYGYMLAIATN